MAGLRLTTFGGLFPSVPPRAMREDAAQVCVDLDASAPEFRPMKTDTTVVADSGLSNPLSLYRLAYTAGGEFNTTMTTGWVVNAQHINYVRGPIDDTTERTYYSFNDGSAAPRVFDVNGNDRLMGVPAPLTAPAVVHNEVDEFTVEDRQSSLTAALETAVTAVRGNATPVWRGATHPGTGTQGYGDQLAAYGFTYSGDVLSNMVRVYRLTGVGGTISNTYCTAATTEFSWVFDPAIGAFYGNSTGTPTWAGTGQAHVGIAFPAYGRTYDLNGAAIESALAAIDMPGMDDGTKLLTTDQVTEIVDELQEYADPDNDFVGPLIKALAQKVGQLQAILDGGPRASLSASVAAFYNKADVAAAISAAKTNFYNTVYNQADLVARSSTPADGVGIGGSDMGGGNGA